MKGCLRNMKSILQELIDADESTRETIISLVANQGVIDGTVENGEEDTLLFFWMTRLNLLDDIRTRINDEELLTEEQKSYFWSIVLEGV